MKVSVITICFNPGPYLEETIRSVIRQDAEDFEYLLIDGGSTDGSVELIQQFAAADPRILWHSAPDGGIADAMNRGVNACGGEIVAFLHADDRYPDATVLSAVNHRFVQTPQALWLTGGLREIDASGAVMRELRPRRFSYRRLLRNNILYHPATFVQRRAFDRIGMFDISLRYAMDYDFWLRLGIIAPPLVVERVLAEFRVHEKSLSSSQRREALEEEYLVRCRYVHSRIARMGHALYQAWRRP